MRAALLMLAVVGALGCGSSTRQLAATVGDGAADGMTCAGDAGLVCWDHLCSDYHVVAVCTGGAWQCPAGFTPADFTQCQGCFGPTPPGCTCPPGAFVFACPDGGAGEAGADASGDRG